MAFLPYEVEARYQREAISNYKKGYRITLTCLACNDIIYSRDGSTVKCKCGILGIRENMYHYKTYSLHETENYKTNVKQYINLISCNIKH